MLTSHVNRVGGLHNSYCQSPICFWPSQSPVVMLHQGTRCSKNKQDLPPVPSGSLSWPWTFHDIWWHPATPPLTRILTSPCPCQKMFILRWPLPIKPVILSSWAHSLAKHQQFFVSANVYTFLYILGRVYTHVWMLVYVCTLRIYACTYLSTYPLLSI